jgi:uncharacterized protein (TIGR00251 family)
MPDTEAYGIEATATGVLINIYVAPRASSNKVVGAHNRELKIALTAPPVEGAANKALVEFVAKTLDVPKGSVSLVSGQASRHKVLRVQGIEAQAVLQRVLSGLPGAATP